MKKIALALVWLTAFVPLCHAWGNISVFLGEKFLDSGDWSPADEQFIKAARLDIGDPAWFANLAFDYYISDYEGMSFENNTLTNVIGRTEEIRLGLRGYYGQKLRFFGGGGITNITSSLNRQTDQGEDICSGSTGYNLFSNGVWFEAGMDYAVGDLFIAGLSGSYSDGRIKCGGKNQQVGGINAGVFFGLSF